MTITLGVFLAFFILSLMLPLTMNRNMKSFTIVYSILTLVSMGALYLLSTMDQVLWSLGWSVAGYLLMLVALGLQGTKINRSDYMAIAVALGFFPWHYDGIASIVYFLVMLVFLAVWGLIATKKGKKLARAKFNKTVDVRAPRKTLNEEQMEVYNNAFPSVRIEVGAFVGAAAAVLPIMF